MDLLFSPRAVARAVAPWLALVLVVVGVGSLVLDQFVLRPEVARLSREGRALVGRVASSSLIDPSAGTRGTIPNRSLIAVDDPELGPQLISIYGRLPVGTTVPVLCLTPARRCRGAEEVKERLSLWPLTPLTLAGSAEVLLAGLLAFATRRPRAARRIAVPLAALCLLCASPARAQELKPDPLDAEAREEFARVKAAFEAKRYEEAAKLAAHIVNAHPRTEFAVHAENIFLDSLMSLGRGRELLAHMDEFERRFHAENWTEFRNWRLLRSDAHEMVARDEERAGVYKECGRSMLAAAENAPDHPRHAERLWDGARCFHRARLVGQAVRMRLELVRDHPRTPLADRALFLIAEGYRRLTYYSKAAEYYEDFAFRNPRDDRSAAALMLAVQLRLALVPPAN